MTEDVRQPSTMDPSETVFPIMEESPEDVDGSRNDATSDPQLPRPRPISEVVNDAFQRSPATHQVSPEIISIITAQVTEQVMKHITQQQVTAASSSSISATPIPSQPSQTVYPPPPPRSPDSTGSTREIFTPPTPEHYPIGDAEQGARPPSVALSDAGSQFSQFSRDSVKSRDSLRGEEMPRPVKTDSSSTIRRRSPANIGSPLRRRESELEKTIAPERDRSRKDSKNSDAGRGKKADEMLKDGETVIEKRWQPLFADGAPTLRLGQFLRGLALRLIDDYEPKGSIVVTPPKMLQFFKDTKVDEEHYPWDVIFGGKMAYASLSVMYRRLVCEHHLIQNNRQEQPNVPGLTPHGFACFMTCLIQAHPNLEYDRLANAVMNMPISNADDKTERFPKELPRRLLPAESNIQAEQRIVSSLNHEPYVLGEIKGAAPMPPPPQRPPHNSFSERERQPYTQPSQYSGSVDDEDIIPASFPIERERKPYTAREGSGKVYTSEDSRSAPTQHRPEASGARSTRANSALPTQGSSYPLNSAQHPPPSDPVNIPPRMPPRRVSFTETANNNNVPNTMPPRMNGGSGGYPPKPMRSSGEERSSRNTQFARSGTTSDFSDAVGSLPNQGGGAFGSSLHHVQSHPMAPPKFDNEEPFRRYYPDRTRNNDRSTEDLSGARPSYNRSGNVPPNAANTFEYGSMGGPVGGPPTTMTTTQGSPMGSGSGASYSSSSRPMPMPMPMPQPNPSTIKEDRRRSMPYGFHGGGDGGTDGYGSFAGTSGGGGYSSQAAPPQQFPYGSSYSGQH